MQEYASRHRTHFSVLLKIDCGYHRAGVDWSSARAVKMALKLEQGRDVHFEGNYTGNCGRCGTPVPGVFDGPPGDWGRKRMPVRINASS